MVTEAIIALFLLMALTSSYVSKEGSSIRTNSSLDPALRNEFAVCILTEELVWINGPYKCGMCNDLMIIRNALLTMLGFGERLEADDGYRGESPRHVK
jgi:hypothetical protein